MCAMEHDVCRRCGSVRRDELGGRATAGGVEGALESGGMRISWTKTEYMRCTHRDREKGAAGRSQTGWRGD